MFTVSIERGPKRRSLAQVQGWLGWLRTGKDEVSALQELLSTGTRYALVANRAGVPFTVPPAITDFTIVDRVAGNSVTDFGAPGVLTMWDTDPWQVEEIDQCTRLLQACWTTWDETYQAIPSGLQQTKPARGRSPFEMRLHMIETDLMHLSAFGPAAKKADPKRLDEQETGTRQQIILGLQAIVPGQQITAQRRYGFDWTTRFAVRRSAWHALDHAWELEDRLNEGDH